MTNRATLELRDADGHSRGRLIVDCLPNRETWREFSTIEVAEDSGLDQVRLLEEISYRYEIELENEGPIAYVEPQEVFSANTAERIEGRISTGRTVGTIRVEVGTERDGRLTCDLEVRSRKLDYETEYRRMMLRLAQEGAELLQSSFAPSSFEGFEPDQSTDAKTLYQRFAFLESLIDSEVFAEAIDAIRYRPHSRHEVENESVDPSRALKPNRNLARQLTRSTERQPLHRPLVGMSSIPTRVTRHTHVETFDTIPNQFVRFALEYWKRLAATISEALQAKGAESERGSRDAARIEGRLEQLLTIPAIASAGPLRQFPGSNTVLNGRSGYRELMRYFLLGEVATSLSWEGGEDVFSAGQRNVATLYEYWVFLELARTIETISGFEFNRSELLAVGDSGMNLELKKQTEGVLRGTGQRRGRTVHLELWFNRNFTRGSTADSSWTVTMRPDCSLLIRPEPDSWETATWVHFDAKYRIQYGRFFESEMDDEEKAAEETTPPDESKAKSEDLRKMHAYRDAIRRTSGAYVLYPGRDDGDEETLRTYHEVLPGLGAFVLRPSENGEASIESSGNLATFLTDVIDHAASQGTGRERLRFWENKSYGHGRKNEDRFDHSESLNLPPADASVLLGFVRSADHLEWVKENKLYNLRADDGREGSVDLRSPVLTADVVVLYDSDSEDTSVFRPTGAFFVRSAADLAESGYPVTSSGSLYVCVGLEAPFDLPCSGSVARALAASNGAPTIVPLEDLLRASSG